MQDIRPRRASRDEKEDEDVGSPNDEDIPQDFICPIGRELMVDPVSTRDGNV